MEEKKLKYQIGHPLGLLDLKMLKSGLFENFRF
jgi:hypothetical protein